MKEKKGETTSEKQRGLVRRTRIVKKRKTNWQHQNCTKKVGKESRLESIRSQIFTEKRGSAMFLTGTESFEATWKEADQNVFPGASHKYIKEERGLNRPMQANNARRRERKDLQFKKKTCGNVCQLNVPN